MLDSIEIPPLYGKADQPCALQNATEKSILCLHRVAIRYTSGIIFTMAVNNQALLVYKVFYA
ncbi:MAG: hypothetical protein WA981_15870 [Glaciecola sp.]